MGWITRLRANTVLSTASILWSVWRNGTQVGQDEFGNTYFRGPTRPGYTRERRWVLYAGEPEATAVPPEWHGWLHHQTDEIPGPQNRWRRPWQKPPQENLTGTDQAYRPDGSTLNPAPRAVSRSGDYEAWTPE